MKSGKPDKKLDRKKPVLVERRIINFKGVHTHTEVDIKSHALRDVLIDINKDVEGLSLKKEPPFVRDFHRLLVGTSTDRGKRLSRRIQHCSSILVML